VDPFVLRALFDVMEMFGSMWRQIDKCKLRFVSPVKDMAVIVTLDEYT